MKSKGFTLAELLGVIIILGLVAVAIAVPILSQINSTSSKLDEATEELLYSNAKLYMSKYSSTYKKVDGAVYYITVQQLINSGLLESNFLDGYSKDEVNESTQIRVIVVSGKYNYQIPTIQLDSIRDKYDGLTITNTYNYAGGTYIKGAYSQNYVMYNGFMWRIMGKNSDGTIRLVMNEPATTLMYYDEVNYQTSYVRNWLNDYFISRLQFNDIIAKVNWYYSASNSINNTTLNSNVYVQDKVGLLSLEEFNLSLQDSNSYLKTTCSGLLNQSDAKFYSTCGTGYIPTVDSNDVPMSVTPVINVYGSIVVTNGTGTSVDPFILAEFENEKAGLTLEEANLSVGSSLIIDSSIYRIVEKNENSIKVVYRDTPVLFDKYASSGHTFNLSNGAGLTLDNGKLPIFLKSNIFLGKIYQMGDNFRNTVFSKSNIVYNVYSSLPVMGELLTTPININNCYWTINMSSSTEAYRICGNGSVNETSVSSYDSNNSTDYSLINTAYIPLDTTIINGTKTTAYCIYNCNS